MVSRRAGELDGNDDADRGDDSTVEYVSPSPTSGPHTPQVEGFEVRRIIGKGGMGTVYEAQQLRPRRTVALKVMKAELDSPGLNRRFETEIQVLATLEHANIARVYEAGMLKDGDALRPYYAMQYIEGALPIDEYAKRHNLSFRTRVELFLKVCDAVYAGHCRGIVHRDLKPENILIDLNGEPKVIDFGVARVLGADLPITTAETGAGQLIGTVRYMSPEQVEGRPDAIDARSDVYTLGVILYELLTGELPYELDNRSLLEITRTIRETPPKHPSSIHRMVTGDFETVVLKAIEKERARRYQTAEALSSDLQRWLRGEPIEARRSTVAYVLTRRFRQIVNHTPIASMLLAALAVGLVLGFFGHRIVYVWTPINYSYRSVLASVAPSFVPPFDRFDRVRVIAIGSADLAKLSELAEMHEVTGVARDNLRSARALGGVLMRRLAEAEVAVVAWDLSFEPDPNTIDGDEVFAEGARALDERGIPVIVVNPRWGIAEDEGLQISSVIAPYVRHAFPAAYTKKEGRMQRLLPPALRGREGWAHIALAVDRGRPEAIPGFALEVVAAYRRPDSRLSLGLLHDEFLAELHYVRAPAVAGSPHWHGPHDRVRFSGIAEPESNPGRNLLLADRTAVYSIEMPAAEVLEHATHSYEWALTAPLGEMRVALKDRIVVIGLTDGRDAHDLGLGQVHHGVYMQAAAVESILREELVRLEQSVFMRSMLAAGCGIGLLVGVWFAGSRWRSVTVVMASIVLLIGLSFWLYTVHRFVFNPLLPMTALALTALVVHGLQRARQDFAI